MKALINEALVIQIEEKDFPVAEPMFWIDIGINPVEVGWSYDGDVFTAPPPPPPPLTLDDIYDQTLKNSRVLKAFILCINDGSIVPGANVSVANLKAAIRAKM